MKSLPSLLWSIVLPRAASLPLRSGPAEAAPLLLYAATPQKLDVQLTLDRMSNCRADPTACPNNTDAAIKAINNTMNSVKREQKDLDIIISDIANCHHDDSQFLKSFDEKVAKHKDCRGRQNSADELHKSCVSLRTTQQTLADSTCSSGILGKSTSELVIICTPGVGVPVGAWLGSMKDTFKVKHEEWEVAQGVCTRATNQLQSTIARCNSLATDLKSVTTSCETELAGLESFACSHAGEHASKCRAYDSCYNSALAKYEAKVAAVPGRIKTWKSALVDAEQMKCYSNAFDPSGIIDAAKLEVCRNASLVDTSKISVTIAKPVARQACNEPRIYPGSSLYRTHLYTGLPAGIKIREPILCLGWKGGCAARSTFDQFDVFLKYNGQYCDVETTGSVACNGKRGTFRFQQENTEKCGVGNVKLTTQPSGEACRYNPLAGLPSLSCGKHAVAGTPAFIATLSSNEPANNRQGTVILAFAGTTVKPLTNFATLSRTDWGANFQKQCSSSGKIGAFNGVNSWHDNGQEDRIFDWKCAYTPDGFSGFQESSWAGMTSWYAAWQRECGSNQVITQVLSNRRVKGQCRLTVWEHMARGGRSESWNGPAHVNFQPNRWVTGGWGFIPYWDKPWPNDEISSLELTGGDHCRVTLYEHEGYGGGSQSFGPGYREVNTFPNDWASSLRVWDEGWVADREYNLMCGATPTGMSLDARPWTHWTNSYDSASSIDCGADAVLMGIKTENSNHHQDRIWAYRCATVSVMAPRQLDFKVQYAE